MTVEDCVYCDEPLHGDVAAGTIGTMEGPRHGHWQCALREVIGGIGHLIAHSFWCLGNMKDPDAGLTRRQSALLVAEYVRVVGVEEAAAVRE